MLTYEDVFSCIKLIISINIKLTTIEIMVRIELYFFNLGTKKQVIIVK